MDGQGSPANVTRPEQAASDGTPSTVKLSEKSQQLAHRLHATLFEQAAGLTLYDQLQAQVLLLGYMVATSVPQETEPQVLREIVANLSFQAATYRRMGLAPVKAPVVTP